MTPPSWRTPYGSYAPTENGYPALRERVTAVERDVLHHEHRLSELVDRVSDGEQQKGRLAHRVGNLEMTNSGRSALESKLSEVPDRVLKLETHLENIQARLKMVLLVGLILAGMMGWLPPEVKSSLLKGLFPPGIPG